MAKDDDDEKDLNDHGVYLLFGDIEEESAEDAIDFILEANLNKSHEELKLIISSEGGDVSAGFAIIDVMNGSKIPVSTVGLGLIASMGLSIFIAGHKGKRVLTPNTSILSHQWFGWAEGKEHELLAVVEHHKLLREKMLRHYKRCTGLTADKVSKILFPPHDVWLSPKDAKKLGICDTIKDV